MEDVVFLIQILKLTALGRDRRAVTALEYGIIAGVLGLVLITIFKSFGTKLSSLFSTIGTSI
jgi:pilus assembly protein Flp/PilA